MNGELSTAEAIGFLIGFTPSLSSNVAGNLLNVVETGDLNFTQAQILANSAGTGSFSNPIAGKLISNIANGNLTGSDALEFASIASNNKVSVTEADTLLTQLSTGTSTSVVFNTIVDAIMVDHASNFTVQELNTALANGNIAPSEATALLANGMSDIPFTHALADLLNLVNLGIVTGSESVLLLQALNTSGNDSGLMEDIVIEVSSGNLTPALASSLAANIPASGLATAVITDLLNLNAGGLIRPETASDLVDLVASAVITDVEATDVVNVGTDTSIDPNIGGVLIDLVADQSLAPSQAVSFGNQIISGGTTDTVSNMFTALDNAQVSVDAVAKLLAVELAGEPYTGAVDDILNNLISGALADPQGAELLDQLVSSGVATPLIQNTVNEVLTNGLPLSDAAQMAADLVSTSLSEYSATNMINAYGNGTLDAAGFNNLLTTVAGGEPYTDAVGDYAQLIFNSDASQSEALNILTLLNDPDVTPVIGTKIFTTIDVAAGSMTPAIATKVVTSVADGFLDAGDAQFALDLMINGKLGASSIDTIADIANAGNEPYTNAFGDILNRIDTLGNEFNYMNTLTNLADASISSAFASSFMSHVNSGLYGPVTANNFTTHIVNGDLSEATATNLLGETQVHIFDFNTFISNNIAGGGAVPTTFIDNVVNGEVAGHYNIYTAVEMLSNITAGRTSHTDIESIISTASSGTAPFASIVNDFVDLITNTTVTGAEASTIMSNLYDPDFTGATAQQVYNALNAGTDGFDAAMAVKISNSVANGALSNNAADDLLSNLGIDVYLSQMDAIIGIADVGEPFAGSIDQVTNLIESNHIDGGDAINFLNKFSDPDVTALEASNVMNDLSANTITKAQAINILNLEEAGTDVPQSLYLFNLPANLTQQEITILVSYKTTTLWLLRIYKELLTMFLSARCPQTTFP